MQEEKVGKAGRQKTSSPRPSSLWEDPTLYQVSVGEGPDSFSTPPTHLQLTPSAFLQTFHPILNRPEYKHTLCICIPRECPWNSPGQNTGVGSLFLLQGIFPTQGSNRGLLLGRQILYHWATWEAPMIIRNDSKYKKLVGKIQTVLIWDSNWLVTGIHRVPFFYPLELFPSIRQLFSVNLSSLLYHMRPIQKVYIGNNLHIHLVFHLSSNYHYN